MPWTFFSQLFKLKFLLSFEFQPSGIYREKVQRTEQTLRFEICEAYRLIFIIKRFYSCFTQTLMSVFYSFQVFFSSWGES